MPSSILRRTLAALTSLAVGSAVGLISVTPAEAGTLSRAYGGSSYGTAAKFGTLISVGRTANQPFCTKASNVSRTNNTAEVDLGALGSVGAQVTRVSSVKTSRTQASVTTSRTAGLTLLSGLITADAIVAKSTVSLDSDGYRLKGETTFTDLRIAGISRPIKPAPNTTINLPLGLGKVILNQQGTLRNFGLQQQGVNGIRVILNPGAVPALPAGELIVSHATASLHSPTFNRPYGVAYATKAQVGSLVRSGSTAAVHLPCGGSDGRTRTNNLVGLNIAGIVTTGTGTTTAKSTDSASATNATTTATIADVDLLNGLVTADAIKVVSSTTLKGKTRTMSSGGTRVLGLRIAGTPVTVPVTPNTALSIAGVGTLRLRRSTVSATGLEVVALQLELTVAQGALPVGTLVNVGYAQSGVA